MFAANQQIIRAEFFVLCFSLYVGVAVLGAPQDGLKGKLLFAVALFLYACWGVAAGFSPQAVHCFMLNPQSCECKSAWKLLKNSHAPANKDEIKRNKHPLIYG